MEILNSNITDNVCSSEYDKHLVPLVPIYCVDCSQIQQ